MLRMTAKVFSDLADHAQRDLPIEACGYLAGNGSIVVKALSLKNIDASSDHFTLDPAEQFAVLRSSRDEGFTIMGAYHSHPSTPARPSSEDLRLASDPDLSYVIISLAGGDPVVRSFRIRNGIAEEEELIVER